MTINFSRLRWLKSRATLSRDEFLVFVQPIDQLVGSEGLPPIFPNWVLSPPIKVVVTIKEKKASHSVNDNGLFAHATPFFDLLSSSISLTRFQSLKLEMPNPVISRGGARNTPQPLRGQGTPLQHAATYESHINAVGVRRPGFGVAGKAMQVTANFFKTTAPKRVIHHYDDSFLYIRVFPMSLSMIL